MTYPAPDLYPSSDLYPSGEDVLPSELTRTRYIVSALPAGSLTASHEVATLVEVLVDGEVVAEIDEAIDGSVTLDSSSSARGRMDLTIPGIDDLLPLAAGDLLTPFGAELRISRGIEYDDPTGRRIDLVRLGVFRIDSSVVSESGDGRQIQITGLDRSGRFIAPDGAFEESGQFTSAAYSDIGTAILQLLTPVYPGLEYDFAETHVALPELTPWQEGDDRWAWAQEIATAIGGELFFNGEGVLVLQPVPQTTSAATPVATFIEGDGGLLLSVSRDWNRENVYNRAIVTGESTSAVVVRGVATDSDPASPTFYGGSFGKKPIFFSSPFISDATQAADCATGLLARSIGVPDNIAFESVVDPARRPGDVVQIIRGGITGSLTSTTSESHVLDSVTIPLPADGRMSCQTRVVSVL